MDISSNIQIPASNYLEPFWKHWKIYPKQTNRNLFGIYTYSGKIDNQRLKKAIQCLSNHNYNLRSFFTESNNQLEWNICENLATKLVTYATNSPQERKLLMENLISKPLNLTQSPLFRFYLIDHKENQQSTLLFIIHHIILDGIQFDNLIKELELYYHSENSNQNTLLINHELGFYIDNLKKQALQSDIDFWAETIKEYIFNYNFSMMSKSTPLTHQKTKTYEFKIPYSYSREIFDFTSTHQISLFNLLKIIWATVIGHYCNQDKIIICHAVSLRNKEFNLIKGSSINILPFGLNLKNTLSQVIEREKILISHYKKNCFIPTINIIEKLNSIQEQSKAENIFKFVIAQTDLRKTAPNFEDYQTLYHLTPNLGSAYLLLEYQVINEEIHYQINFLSPAFEDTLIIELGQKFSRFLVYLLRNINVQLLHIKPDCNEGLKDLFSHKETLLSFYQTQGGHW